MKRILSWIVLAICQIVSAKLIQLIVYIGVGIASRLYGSSRGIFWVIIFVGGSFGLGIAYAFSFAAVALCARFSNKVCLSEKGTRYKVGSVIMGLLFTADFILCFSTGMEGDIFAKQIITDIFAIFFCVLLFIQGRIASDED